MTARFLVIDADQLVFETLSACLAQEFDAIAEQAGTAAQGRQMLAHSRFDLVLIDMFLPNRFGIDLLAVAANENVPVLLISGDPATQIDATG
jgi:response regulator of citrate/malate metabolism